MPPAGARVGLDPTRPVSRNAGEAAPPRPYFVNKNDKRGVMPLLLFAVV